MRSGAESKSRIDAYDDGVIGACFRVTGANPKALSEVHGPEVLEPFTLPGAIGQRLNAVRWQSFE